MYSVKSTVLNGGFPHSDIRGSKIALISPRLFAECHVLLRLLSPRHPPDALNFLSFYVYVKSYIQLYCSLHFFYSYPQNRSHDFIKYFIRIKTTLNIMFSLHLICTSYLRPLTTLLHLKNADLSSFSDKHEPNTRLVEVNGIEPMTYSLQSYRSPN